VTSESIHKKFSLDIQTSNIARRSQVLHIEEGQNSTFIHTTVEYSKKNSAEDVSDERAVDAFSTGLCHSDLVEELGRTSPRTVSELMEVANRFADGEDAYNNKRAHSPEVDRISRQRRRSRIKDSRTRQNQIAAGYERRDEEGYGSMEFQNRNTHEKEKIKYYGPSAEDMLHRPCRIHYAYLDGKRVSNHQMKDCKTFLRLQNAMELNEGAHRGGTSTSQGYQVQRFARQLASKVYISAMIQPVPKSKKRVEEHIKTSKLSNIITTSNYRKLEVVRPARQVQQSRPPKKSTQARTRANGVEGTNRGIRHWVSIHGHRKRHKPDIRKDSKGNEHITRKPEVDRLLFPCHSTRERKPPPWEN
jgi:hypothetical protein